ncbi:MAG: hypothetical protein ACE5IK_09720 [Acidobacteriota bacterium]
MIRSFVRRFQPAACAALLAVASFSGVLAAVESARVTIDGMT